MMCCIRWHFSTIFHSQENSANWKWKNTFDNEVRNIFTPYIRTSTLNALMSCLWLVSLASHWSTNILKCSCRKDWTACLMASKLQCYNWGCAVALSFVATSNCKGVDSMPSQDMWDLWWISFYLWMYYSTITTYHIQSFCHWYYIIKAVGSIA
jgi:hypothetical protein